MDQRREDARDTPSRDDARPRPHDGSRPERRRPAPVDTGAKRRRTSEEIHTRPRRRPTAEHAGRKPKSSDARDPAPKKTPPGSFRDAVTTWATRPVAGVKPKHIGRSFVALLTVIVLGVTGFGWSRVNSLNSAVTLLDDIELGKGGDDGAIDVLLVGTDSRTDAKGNPLSDEELKWLRVAGDITTSTDTILLIRIPTDGSAATAVSIPRDSYVEVPGLGKSKINAAYGATREEVRIREVESGSSEEAAEAAGAKAGRQALIDSVANLTGVTVDHYAEVGLLGFALLTDAVGGVEVCLKNRVNEPFSGARFRKGRQTLSGPEALSFVRQRHDLPRGDLDRITRQQVYMASLAQKILSSQTLTDPGKLGELQDAVSRSVMIDDGWNIISFAEQLKDLSGGNVKFTTIPIADDQAWSDDGTQSVLGVDTDAVHTYISKLLGRTSPSTPSNPRNGVKVDVVNAGTVDGLASNVAGVLGRLGYSKGATSSKPINEFDSIVFANSTDSDAAKQLVKDLGGNIEIREDSSLGDDQLRAVLTNTYAGAGSIVQTGDQGQDDQSASPTTSSTANTSPVIKADTDGPVCVN
ncbi:LCP family protein [Gordonia sp. PDNC005]|uniref:LCP family protein n=1 Tax=Gordonia sp. PDNC005 TaxID=2811424 RepID=UPI00196410F2|nr:LCP family protein [Gordonia sp. PDNC005]QRY63549.1 LCP family protein [Gordonia sp. PDNC005]